MSHAPFPAAAGSAAFKGRAIAPTFDSDVLRGNPLGDPHLREVPIYLPPAALDGERLPVVFLLAGFTGRGHSLLETHPWRRGAIADYDRALTESGEAGAILVMPDAFTRLGGSQYVNSGAVGRYADYVGDELPAFVDSLCPTSPGARAVAGKSSGGFGALHLAMTKPGVFRAAASISGDCAFELPMFHEMIGAARALLPHGGDPRSWLAEFEKSIDLGGDGHAAINTIAMAACYAPNPESPYGFDLPFDPETMERRPEVWERFMAFDPLNAVEHHVATLSALKLLYIEAGTKDEFGLQFGARRLSRRLHELGIPHEAVEHEGGHFGLDRRYPLVIPKLALAATS